jgi:hypothetical protein
MPDIRRDDIGVWIGSADYDIHLTPVLAYPIQPEGLFVRVYARPTPAGEFPGQCLYEEKRWGFGFEDIVVGDTRLECWRQHEHASSSHTAFRKGFCLALEPGVIAALRAWLPPLCRVARIARSIAIEFERSRGRGPTRDEQRYIGQIVSARVFGDCGTSWSYAPQLERHLQAPAVTALLATCGTDFHALAKNAHSR